MPIPIDASAQRPLPDDLRARLAAAGVSDDASLAAALQRDPALAADLQAFVEANVEAQIGGDLYQAGRDQHFFSAHAEDGGAATVVNQIFIQSLERRWSKPKPPRWERDAVLRPQEMARVREGLASRGQVTIAGQAALAPTLAMHGTAGVGKTTLAHLLALEADQQYPDGVIWEHLGPDFQTPDQAQAILRRWAGLATGFFGLPDNVQKLFAFEAEAVQSLLAEHPRLLVVLDNVWGLPAIRPLQDALPPGAHLIVTTRSREIANGLAAGLVEVGLLSQDEALALFDLRLGWRPDEAHKAGAHAWAFALVGIVGRHALGLDVALGVLRNHSQHPADWPPQAQRLTDALRAGELEQLNLGDGDPGHNVKAVLLWSYRALRDDETRRRLRVLAAFAPEAEFSTALAAAAWGCAQGSALETLTGFANAALLDRLGGGAWRQHGLLRAFGAALLRDAGERDQAAAAHARAADEAMAAADDEQRYYQMLPAMPQLRHAFEWALANDLELALSIAANCANLMRQFGLTREAGAWSERLLSAARAGRAAPAVLARVHGHRANRLSELATLPGEDRRQRLYEALAAYDDALRFRRPDNAPLDYATTQNNRATILSALATLPGEDRRQRLYEALAAYDDALRFSRPDNAPLDYAQTQNNRALLLSELATLPGEDRRARLIEALRCAAQAVSLFEQFQQAQYLEIGRRVLRGIRDECGDDFANMWAELDLGEPPGWVNQAAGEPILALLQEYQAQAQAADADQPQVAPWQAVVDLGERLLAMQAGAERLLDWDGLRERVASDYNTLGNALDSAGNPAAALAAFERAVALQPGFAMWRRNQAGMLIELGRLGEARVAIDQARALEPDAPRLAQLEAQLAEAAS